MFRIYVYLAILGVLVASHGFAFMQGRNSKEVKDLKQATAVSEKRNEIINNRPDTDVFLDGLLNDEQW